MNDYSKLLLLTQSLGRVFGTEELSSILYGLIKMHKPKVIVELGTGFGVSAFWMALALRENDTGHLWTIDDGQLIKDIVDFDGIMQGIVECSELESEVRELSTFINMMAKSLGLQECLSFIESSINLFDTDHFNQYPFANDPIDLLFSDFNHEPSDIIALLSHFLPRMSKSSSIFIDSASTFWPSYLLLENIVDKLNQGRLPEVLTSYNDSLENSLKRRKYTLVHLTKAERELHNGTAWLKIEPIDVRPYPLTSMRYK